MSLSSESSDDFEESSAKVAELVNFVVPLNNQGSTIVDYVLDVK